MAVLNSPLTPGEFNSLRQISLPMGRIVPDSHKAQLKRLGYTIQKPGGWALTALGRQRLDLGK